MSDFVAIEELRKLLPDRFQLDDSGYLLYQVSSRKTFERISNYLPVVKQWKRVCVPNQQPVIQVTFSLCIQNTMTDEEWCELLSEIDKVNFTTACNPRCYNEFPGSKTNMLIAQVVLHQLQFFTPIEVPYFEQLGWKPLLNENVYCAGNMLITGDGIYSGEFKIDPELERYSLDISDEITENEAINYLFDLMPLYPKVTDVLVANLIVGLTRTLFMDAQVPPKYAIYLVSLPHKGKTTYCTLINSIYNRSRDKEFNLANLSTITLVSMLQEISRFKDCPYIIDDLYVENNISAMKKREAAVSTAIRTVANNAENRKQSGKETVGFVPNATIVVTAEYLLEHAYSTLSRCVILHLERQLETEKISPFQRQPLALSTAAYYFIRWVAAHYESNVELIRSEHEQFRERMDSATPGFERLHESCFALEMGVRLLCNYAVDANALTREGAENTMASMREIFSQIIEKQKEDMEISNSIEESSDLTYVIGCLLKQKKFRLASSKDEYDSKIHDGIQTEFLICLASKKLVQTLRNYLYDSTINQERISHHLKGHGLLVMDQSEDSTKKTKRVRMFHIRKNELILLLESRKEQCHSPS